MMQNNNVAVLLGRLTADPELRTIPSGAEVVSFTIAVDRPPDRNGERHADFIDCSAWRATATFIAKHFHKGDVISVAGSIQTRSYEYEGKKRKATEILVDSAGFTGGGRGAGAQTGGAPRRGNPVDSGEPDDDGVPF